MLIVIDDEYNAIKKEFDLYHLSKKLGMEINYYENTKNVKLSKDDIIIIDLFLSSNNDTESKEFIKKNKNHKIITCSQTNKYKYKIVNVNNLIELFHSGAVEYFNKELIVNKNKKDLDSVYYTILNVINPEKDYITCLGESESIQKVRNKISKIKNIDDVEVYIYGETGTGKELVARLIHQTRNYHQTECLVPKNKTYSNVKPNNISNIKPNNYSNNYSNIKSNNFSNIKSNNYSNIKPNNYSNIKSNNDINNPYPFIARNCAEFNIELLKSELFGHKKGAFTGAIEDKVGVLESVGSGTLFLDEVGELSSEIQSSLLRVLQFKKFNRLGEDDPKYEKEFKGHLVFATNSRLEKLVKSGKFRNDLMFRIAVWEIEVPPLKNRKDDLPLLFVELLKKWYKKYNSQLKEIDIKILNELEDYSFPGNIRELENIIRCLLIQTQGKEKAELNDFNEIFQKLEFNEKKFDTNMFFEHIYSKIINSEKKDRKQIIEEFKNINSNFYNWLKNEKNISVKDISILFNVTYGAIKNSIDRNIVNKNMDNVKTVHQIKPPK